mmetsp:Transcript_4987/g.12529  ORF Transcript_4987/g.12529 Transcript_4987/m.12529 type:complete len:328 (+) Transcript_4987:1-984(+)
MEELNGNGEENVFYCDRIACPEGTYNMYGFHHGVHGETCEPCYDETPFIGQKMCTHKEKSASKFNWREKVEKAKETSEEMGVSKGVAVTISFAILLLVILICYLVANLRSDPQKIYERGKTDENRNTGNKSYNDDAEEEEDDAGYTFGEPDHPRHQEMEYRDFVITDDDEDKEPNRSNNSVEEDDAFDDEDDDGDDNRSRMTARSATDLVSDHQGMALNRREKFKKAVSGRVPEDLSKRAREAASSISVSARKLGNIRNAFADISQGNNEYNGERENIYDEGSGVDLELTNRSSTSTSDRDVSSQGKISHGKKQVQPHDLLDVPMIT